MPLRFACHFRRKQWEQLSGESGEHCGCVFIKHLLLSRWQVLATCSVSDAVMSDVAVMLARQVPVSTAC